MSNAEEYRKVDNVGLIIRERRIRRGLSQRELSQQANITRSFLNQIETGHRKPSINTLEVIADRLNESVGDLIDAARSDDGDPRIRLAYLLARLIKNADDKNVDRLLKFVQSLDTSE